MAIRTFLILVGVATFYAPQVWCAPAVKDLDLAVQLVSETTEFLRNLQREVDDAYSSLTSEVTPLVEAVYAGLVALGVDQEELENLVTRHEMDMLEVQSSVQETTVHMDAVMTSLVQTAIDLSFVPPNLAHLQQDVKNLKDGAFIFQDGFTGGVGRARRMIMDTREKVLVLIEGLGGADAEAVRSNLESISMTLGPKYETMMSTNQNFLNSLDSAISAIGWVKPS